MSGVFYKIAEAAGKGALSSDANKLLLSINDKILNPAIGFLMALALMFFLYGIVEFMAGSANEETRSTGRQHMIWGIVGLFIMVSVFGIMRVVLSLWQ